MYTDNRGNAITPQRMRQLGKDLGAQFDQYLASQFLDSALAPMFLASMLLGEAKRLGWSLDDLFKMLTELQANQVNNG